MEECIIDFNVNDRPPSIRALLHRMQPALHPVSKEPVRIDLRKCHYLGPDATAILGAVILMARDAARTAEVLLPDTPPQLAAFCEFSGLNHLVKGTAEPDMTHPDSVTVPLRRLEQARHGDVEPIYNLIRAYADLGGPLEDALGIAFTEVVQNVVDHSGSPIGAVTSARYLTGRHEVRIAVVDMGLGIGTTLRRSHPDTRDARHALARVLEGGFSARTRQNNLGQGINNLRLTVTSQGGEIFLISENANALVRAGSRRPRFETSPDRFPGTGVFFTLPTRA
jgi:hypothetical protein